ncbi:MAG: aminotransferase class I/II-fold pyridoxal phosphate-dependent enzyme [Limisphaerales bacterium]
MQIELSTKRTGITFRSLPVQAAPTKRRITISIATAEQRERIYQIRHDVFADELHQHAPNVTGKLTDQLDAFNAYIVAEIGSELVGFVSITPPGRTYSIDKYIERDDLPFPLDEGVYEVRLLTLLKPFRRTELATQLMYAAFRWIESHGGTRIVGIGRREIMPMYLKVGLQRIGVTVHSGDVAYDVMHAAIGELRGAVQRYAVLFDKLEKQTNWHLDFPYRKPAACFHGGAFFDAIGEKFQTLDRRHDIINADVLDAWFPPSPKVTAALEQHLPWLLRTSPPTGCDGLIEAIAEARDVDDRSILPGAGSSDLIFLALRQWLKPTSRVLILDPTYGEYAHVLERVVRCRVDRFTLNRANGYQVDLNALDARLTAHDYDLLILVNPNSPTGRHIGKSELQTFLQCIPSRAKVWIDETYIEYVGRNQSLESFAAQSENVVICKSMSKVYALSGARAAYLCAPPHLLEELRSITPPWAVSLLGQVAVNALADPEYYAARYAETHRLRESLASELESIGFEIIPGIANYLLCHLPDHAAIAADIVQRCREQNVYLRDASPMGTQLGDRALRIAVEDAATNAKIIAALKRCCNRCD